MGDILKSPPKWLVRPAKTLYVRRTSTLAVIHVAHSRVLLPGRGESPCRPRNAERPPRLAGKLLVHHEDGVVSTVGARLDSGVQWIALPPPIDDVAIPVTSGRQVDDLLPDSIAGFHLASVQVPVVEVAHHLDVRRMASFDGEDDLNLDGSECLVVFKTRTPLAI